MARISEATELTQWGGENCLTGEMDEAEVERLRDEEALATDPAWEGPSCGPVIDMEEVTF